MPPGRVGWVYCTGLLPPCADDGDDDDDDTRNLDHDLNHDLDLDLGPLPDPAPEHANANASSLRDHTGTQYSILNTPTPNINDGAQVLDVNLKACWLLCQAAGQHMVPRRRGKIINFCSLLTYQVRALRRGV